MTLTDDISLPESPSYNADSVSSIENRPPRNDRLDPQAELCAHRIGDFLQTVAQPERLLILSGLCACREATADELAELLGESRDHVLKHLSGMLADGVVAGRIAADDARYRIARPRLRRIVDRMLTGVAAPDAVGARVVQLRPSA